MLRSRRPPAVRRRRPHPMTPAVGTNPRTPTANVLAALALAAFSWSGFEAWTLSAASARQPCADVTGVARSAVAQDTRFVAAYVSALLLVAAWAWVAAGATTA